MANGELTIYSFLSLPISFWNYDVFVRYILVEYLPNIQKLLIFIIMKIDGKFVESIIQAGEKLGIKKKNEDMIGRVLKEFSILLLKYKRIKNDWYSPILQF